MIRKLGGKGGGEKEFPCAPPPPSLPWGGGGREFLKDLCYVFLIWCVMWRDSGLSAKQRDAADTSGRLVSVMINVCEKEIGEEVCVCVCGGGGGEWGGEGGKRVNGKDGRGGKRE